MNLSKSAEMRGLHCNTVRIVALVQHRAEANAKVSSYVRTRLAGEYRCFVFPRYLFR